MSRETTATHWCAAGRDYGWPNHSGLLVVDLWAPHGQDIPEAWIKRFTNISEFDERRALQR